MLVTLVFQALAMSSTAVTPSVPIRDTSISVPLKSSSPLRATRWAVPLKSTSALIVPLPNSAEPLSALNTPEPFTMPPSIVLGLVDVLPPLRAKLDVAVVISTVPVMSTRALVRLLPTTSVVPRSSTSCRKMCREYSPALAVEIQQAVHDPRVVGVGEVDRQLAEGADLDLVGVERVARVSTPATLSVNVPPIRMRSDPSVKPSRSILPAGMLTVSVPTVVVVESS